jgi:hypothetical protein
MEPTAINAADSPSGKRLVQEHDMDCDVLVAGGGPAGVPCALAAARNGAKVILCQDRSMLGGNASSEVRMHIVGANGGRGSPMEVEAREGGIIEEIRLTTSTINPQRSAAMLDLILYDLCRREPNLTLMLDTRVTGADVEHGRIVRAHAERPSTEDAFRIKAKVFVDCTGDGQLGAAAGATFRRGREGKDEFAEQLAQPQADRFSLGSTILFIAKKHDRPMVYSPPPWARKFTEEDLRLRPHASAGVDRGLEYGYWWVEWGGHLDTLKDNPQIRDELMAIVMGVWDHIKNGGDHGAENWALDWFGFYPAKRETRRFYGQYILHEGDLMRSTAFEDAIAYGGWPIDTHPHRGIDAPEEAPCNQIKVPKLFDIPLRSCVSREVSNLMFAGRNISATHVAFASTRVMATCAVMGQGVGTAAAYAVQKAVAPVALASDRAAMRSIQQRLLRDDAYLVGVRNEHAHDLARSAVVSASSAQAGGGAELAVNGQTRSVHGHDGAPEGRTIVGANRWMSDPARGLPAWLELQWEKEVQLAEIRLVFDTGLDRILTLSHSDDFVKKMRWGTPQPETVKSYVIEAYSGGQWRRVLSVENNFQRLVVHRLAQPLLTGRLRVVVSATHGIDHARICELRAYGGDADSW